LPVFIEISKPSFPSSLAYHLYHEWLFYTPLLKFS
jgi:hypothetical protein